MAITELDLKYFLSEEVSSAPTNGGLMSQNEAVTGVKNNLWPNASSQDRADGKIDYRKVFGSPQSDSDDALENVKIWNHAPTPGDDYVLMFAGTKTDTQATISEARAYGTGQLKNDVNLGATVSVVTVENADMIAIYVDQDVVRFSSQESPELSGTFEEVNLTAAPSVVGLDITLQHDALSSAYLAADTVVSSVYEPGTTESGVGTISVSSVSGGVDESGFPPVTNNTGTLDETLTISFTSASDFTVLGSRSGALDAGNKNSDYTAVNPVNGKNIITLPSGFFTGTYAALETVTIPTVANNFAFWLKKIIPAGSGSLNGDFNITAYTGES